MGLRWRVLDIDSFPLPLLFVLMRMLAPGEYLMSAKLDARMSKQLVYFLEGRILSFSQMIYSTHRLHWLDDV